MGQTDERTNEQTNEQTDERTHRPENIMPLYYRRWGIKIINSNCVQDI